VFVARRRQQNGDLVVNLSKDKGLEVEGAKSSLWDVKREKFQDADCCGPKHG
jgi:hypothetical protein